MEFFMLGLLKKPKIVLLIDDNNIVRGIKNIHAVDPSFKGFIRAIEVCKKEKHLFQIGDKAVIWQDHKKPYAYSPKHAQKKSISMKKIADKLAFLNIS